MIALLSPDCTLRQKATIVARIESAGLHVHLDRLEGREWIGILGSRAQELAAEVAPLEGVDEIREVSTPYALVARSLHPESSRVRVGSMEVGGPEIAVIAGPCAVESEEQIRTTARVVAAAGARALRGGAYKPRTSPYSFQGLGSTGLELLAAAGRDTGLPVVTEVVSPEEVERVAEQADMLQIGARNMQNFRLLQAAGGAGRPVLLKRGMIATIDELLLAAEYVLDAGNPDVILCERGIRTFDRSTRNTLDLAAIPLLKEKTHLPVIADPSHGCGVRSLVPALAVAAVAAGADGLIVEVHPKPEEALSDGEQSLRPSEFESLMESLDAVARAVGRRV